MIVDEKPPLTEALLEHHGVKGMHWGVRKHRTVYEQAKHDRRVRIAKNVGKGALAVGAAAGAAYLLSQHGHIPVKTIAAHAEFSNNIKKYGADFAKKAAAGAVASAAAGGASRSNPNSMARDALFNPAYSTRTASTGSKFKSPYGPYHEGNKARSPIATPYNPKLSSRHAAGQAHTERMLKDMGHEEIHSTVNSWIKEMKAENARLDREHQRHERLKVGAAPANARWK